MLNRIIRRSGLLQGESASCKRTRRAMYMNVELSRACSSTGLSMLVACTPAHQPRLLVSQRATWLRPPAVQQWEWLPLVWRQLLSLAQLRSVPRPTRTVGWAAPSPAWQYQSNDYIDCKFDHAPSVHPPYSCPALYSSCTGRQLQPPLLRPGHVVPAPTRVVPGLLCVPQPRLLGVPWVDHPLPKSPGARDAIPIVMHDAPRRNAATVEVTDGSNRRR